MKTIIEKARIAFEKGREVTICFNTDEELTGFVLSYASYDTDQITLRYKKPYVKHIPLHDITDVRFMGEAEAEAESVESFKSVLEHALAFGYPVRVTFKGCVKKGTITEAGESNFMMSVCDGAWLHYHDVLSVQRLEARKTSADDIAPERWEIEKEDDGQYWRIINGVPFYEEPFTVLAWHLVKPETARLMAAAPELADALENVFGWIEACGWDCEDSAIINRAKAVLCKARGKE